MSPDLLVQSRNNECLSSLMPSSSEESSLHITGVDSHGDCTPSHTA